MAKKLSARILLLVAGVTLIVFFSLRERNQAQPERREVTILVKAPSLSFAVTAPLGRTYVAVLELGHQQGSGVRSLSSLQCMLSSFYSHFYVVEPLIKEHTVGLYTGQVDSSMNFSSLFDFDAFNAESRKMGYPEMVKLEEYLKLSPRFVACIIIAEPTMTSTEAVIWFTTKKGTKCFDNVTDKLMHPYDSIVSNAQQKFSRVIPQHCIVRIVELRVTGMNYEKLTKEIPTKKIYSLAFGDWSPHDISLLFTFYGHSTYIPVDKPLHGLHCMQHYADYEVIEQFKPSQRLLRDANEYKDRFLEGQKKMAVMLRFERVSAFYLTEEGPKKSKSLEQCFEEVLNVSVILRQKYTDADTLKSVVTMDVGRFGTTSNYFINYESAISLSKRALSAFYSDQWSLAEWEDSFLQVTGGETRGMYIAALQRILASQADCLILMGGGSFQALAVRDYLSYHSVTSEKCIHLVCVMTEKNIEVQKTISKYSLQ